MKPLGRLLVSGGQRRVGSAYWVGVFWAGGVGAPPDGVGIAAGEAPPPLFRGGIGTAVVTGAGLDEAWDWESGFGECDSDLLDGLPAWVEGAGEDLEGKIAAAERHRRLGAGGFHDDLLGEERVVVATVSDGVAHAVGRAPRDTVKAAVVAGAGDVEVWWGRGELKVFGCGQAVDTQ
jgi:hypothetical protein